MSYSCYGHRFLSFLPSSLRFLLTFKLPCLYVCPFFSLSISLSVCPPVFLLATVFLSLCVSLCIYLFSFSVPLSLFFLALFVSLPPSPFHLIITRIPKYKNEHVIAASFSYLHYLHPHQHSLPSSFFPSPLD